MNPNLLGPLEGRFLLILSTAEYFAPGSIPGSIHPRETGGMKQEGKSTLMNAALCWIGSTSQYVVNLQSSFNLSSSFNTQISL